MFLKPVLTEIIQYYVAKLDRPWFEMKELEFRKEKAYIEDEDIICIIDIKGHPNYGENEELIGYEETEDIYKYSFSKYCACHLPICEITDWGCSPAWYFDSASGYVEEKSNNIDEIAGELVNDLARFLTGEADVVVIHKFISRQLENIEIAIGEQKKILNNDLYESVLDDLLKLCTYKLYKRYEKQLIRYNEITSYEAGLKFELNQNELLSLLFLIQRAGFLTYASQNELLQFCYNHFLYKNENGVSVRPTSLKTLQKKYSNINASQAPTSKQDLFVTGLSTVSQKLNDVIKNLR